MVTITPESDSAASKRTRVIVACADPEIQQLLLGVLNELGLQAVLSTTLDDAEALLVGKEAAIVLSQPRFSHGSYREVLRAAAGPGSKVPVILCSEFYDEDLYLEAMSLGAFDYLAFPYHREEVARVVKNALAQSSPVRKTGASSAGQHEGRI
jgi:DNA-binding NtrC family response regulator